MMGGVEDDMWQKERCPDALRKPYYPIEMCNLNDKPCLLETGNDCPYYEEFLKELEATADGKTNNNLH